MAKNSNTSAAGVLGPRRRSSDGSSTPKLVDAQELWDIDDVADYLGVTKQTIYSWRTTGYGPAGFRVGKHLRWRAGTTHDVKWAAVATPGPPPTEQAGWPGVPTTPREGRASTRASARCVRWTEPSRKPSSGTGPVAIPVTDEGSGALFRAPPTVTWWHSLPGPGSIASTSQPGVGRRTLDRLLLTAWR